MLHCNLVIITNKICTFADWMLATTKKVKKERVKHKQEHEIDDRKSASTVLKEAKSNVGAALKDSSVAVMEKSSKAVSQNNVSLEATAKQQKKVVEPEVNKPQPTQSKEAAQAVMTNTNGSVVIEKGEAAVASQLSTSSSKASEIIPAKAEKSDQSKKKGKKDKQPAAVVSQTVEQTKSSTAPDIKPVATAAKEVGLDYLLRDGIALCYYFTPLSSSIVCKYIYLYAMT